MSMLARIQPVDLDATRSVFVSAFALATSIVESCPPFGDELRASAREQIEYMLGEDEDTLLIMGNDEVKSVVRESLSSMCSSFESNLASLLVETDLAFESAKLTVSKCLNDLEWMCNMLPKMDLMKDFVAMWFQISGSVLGIIEDKRLDSLMWDLKLKLIIITSKVLDAVGYGNVILPASSRVQLLKLWLPYISKIKPLLDLKSNEDMTFSHKMDDELCENIEGAIVQYVLALPSNDQANILAEWMRTEKLMYPDLTEAFEVWCYRSKSAKRRFLEGGNGPDDAAISP